MVQSFIQATGDRVIDRWRRPQALPGGALTIGYTIFTTGENARAFAMNTGEALLVTALTVLTYGRGRQSGCDGGCRRPKTK
jgi:hypothetical protein